MFSKSLSSYLRGGVAVLVLILLSCTEKKTYVTNNPVTDQRPPLVEWISPPGGSAVQGTVSLTFVARDESGIDSARPFLDGTSRADFGVAGSNDSVYTFLWDTRSDSDGVHSLEISAYDKAGNQGNSRALLLHVQNTPQPPAEDHIPPQVTWIAPTGGSEFSGTVSVELSAWDAGGVDSVRLYINGVSPVGRISNPTPPDTIYTYIWNTPHDSDGVYVLEARAWDKAGNTGVSPVIMIRVHNNPAPPPEDRTPPEIGWIEPVGGSELKDVATLKLQAFDNVHVDSVWVYKNGVSPAEWRQVSSPDADSTYTFLWNTTHDSDGVYVLEARAWDESRNIGFAPSLAVRVTNHPAPPGVDRTPPRVTWLSPSPGSIIRDTTQLQFEATDDVGVDSVQVFVDGELSWSLSAAQNMHYAIDMNSWRWINGRRIVEVRAYDAAGNVGIGNPIGLTVDNHRVLWVPDDYATIQGAINDSRDGDTITVRSGVYHEQLQFFDKKASLISESGPERTIIDGTDYYTAIWMVGGQDTTVLIRGFTFSNSSDFICYGAVFDGSSPKIENNIFTANGVLNCNGFHMEQNNAIMRNNLFIYLRDGIEIGHSFGADFSNNMILHTYDYALFNRAINGQFLIPDYNLIWDYNNLWNVGWGPHNIIDQEPQFIQGTYVLQPGSPGVNQGRPDILDPDGSISDIGVYGGPLQYPPPNQ